MAVPKFLLVLVDIAIIKQVAAFNPFPATAIVAWAGDCYLFTSGAVDACDRGARSGEM